MVLFLQQLIEKLNKSIMIDFPKYLIKLKSIIQELSVMLKTLINLL